MTACGECERAPGRCRSNDGGGTLLSQLGLSVAILAPSGMPPRRALRLAVLTRAAARHLPMLAAHELARNVLCALELDAPFDEVFLGAVEARRVRREGPGAWVWPAEVSASAVHESMSQAWRSVAA